MKYSFHPDAEDELNQAIDYYEEHGRLLKAKQEDRSLINSPMEFFM